MSPPRQIVNNVALKWKDIVVTFLVSVSVASTVSKFFINVFVLNFASLIWVRCINTIQMSQYLKPVAFTAFPFIGGFAGSLISRQNIETWYEHLKKPSWRPPNWLFGPAWSVLYGSMGYASYLVWRDGGGFQGDAALPLACYGTQLALNWAWTPIFFGAHKLGLATLEIGAMWGSIVATIYMFHSVNPTAGYIMLPYLGWVSFASVLTFCIWRDNKDRKD